MLCRSSMPDSERLERRKASAGQLCTCHISCKYSTMLVLLEFCRRNMEHFCAPIAGTGTQLIWAAHHTACISKPNRRQMLHRASRLHTDPICRGRRPPPTASAAIISQRAWADITASAMLNDTQGLLKSALDAPKAFQHMQHGMSRGIIKQVVYNCKLGTAMLPRVPKGSPRRANPG